MFTNQTPIHNDVCKTKQKMIIDYSRACNLFLCLNNPRIRESCLVYGINATFNNMSVISWWSVILMAETGVPGENHRPVTSH